MRGRAYLPQLCLIGSLMILPPVAFSENAAISHFAFVRDINPVDTSASVFSSARLDDKVFLSVGTGYDDLAVLDSEDNIVPSIVRPVTQSIITASTSAIRLGLLSKTRMSDGTLELLYEKTQDMQVSFPREVVFVSETKDYEMLASVEDSLNGTVWTQLVSDHPIFDYTSHLGLRRNIIPLPDNRSLFFKISIYPVPGKRLSPLNTIADTDNSLSEAIAKQRKAIADSDFSLSHISFRTRTMKRVQTSRLRHPYLADSMGIHQDTETKTTIITFDSVGGPVTELSISVLDRNFSRTVRVEGARELQSPHSWEDVCVSRIKRITIPGFAERKTSISLNGPSPYRKYRLTITNGDLSPLTILDIQARGEIHEVLFPSSVDGTYRLAYGGGPAPTSTVPCDVTAAVNDNTASCMLGPERENPAYLPISSLPSTFCRLAIPALVAGVLILLAALFRQRTFS